MTVLALQRRLKSLGFDVATDGLIGPQTLRAVNAALDRLPGAPAAPEPLSGHVPIEWMPWAKMERVIAHWTAGGHKANSTDKNAYHILIQGDGKLVRGNHSIKDNEAPINGPYAAHCLNLNSGSIGVSLCCMAGATEVPFNAGPAPMTRVQWKKLGQVVADLCQRYSIPVTRGTVLSHAEVQSTLGVKQKNKWDYTRLAFDPEIRGHLVIGNMMRSEVNSHL